MIKAIATAALFLSFSVNAWAGTSSIFGRDDSKATVLMLAVTQNPDAIAFFNVLSMPAQDESGRSVKRFQFIDEQEAKPFTAVCVFSKLVEATGSCTLVFYPARGIYISGAEGRIRYDLKGDDAKRLAEMFNLPAETGEVFRSSDGMFVITVGRDGTNGTVTYLSIAYGHQS